MLQLTLINFKTLTGGGGGEGGGGVVFMLGHLKSQTLCQLLNKLL